MAHLHTHDKDHHHSKAPKNGLIIAILVLFIFAAVEVVGGWLANSLTLLSDAGHMATDGLSLLLAVFASWIANKPPSRKHSYGLGRAEVLGAWVNSLAMVLIALWIGFHAFERLARPQPVIPGYVIPIAFLGILINLLLVWILRHTEQTLNLRAAILHVLGDLLGSVAALVSGVVIFFTGWLLIDPLLSLFIALLILLSSIGLLKETLLVLMEGVPLHLNLSDVGKRMASAEKVLTVHDLHIWTLSSGLIILSAHIELADLTDWPHTLSQLQTILTEEFNIKHITLQPEIRGHVARFINPQK